MTLENTGIETESNELTDERMDQLIESTNTASNREMPMTDADVPKADAPAQAPSESDQFEFKIGDKTIKGTREQVLKWAQMGYSYPQKAQALNQERAKWDSERKQWEQKTATYRQIDEWAAKNPDQWARIQQLYSQHANGGQAVAGQTPSTSTPDVQAQVQTLVRQALGPVQEFIQQTQAEKQAAVDREADQKLNQDIQSIREQFKDLDWDNPDENGKSLEQRVVDHAMESGIPSFRASFRDLLHDQLIDRERAQAKMAVSRGIQEKTRMGILGQTPTPTKGFSAPKDVGKQSYEDLAREALAELKSGKAS